MTNQIKNQEQVSKEMNELSSQFSEFLHTKGISAKFKLAFANMNESLNAQREADKANFEEVKAKSAEENKEFVEFLHTKGFKAKCRLVVENIKKGAAEASEKNKENIAKLKADNAVKTELTAEELSKEFNEFLKSKNLDSEYIVIVEKK